MTQDATLAQVLCGGALLALLSLHEKWAFCGAALIASWLLVFVGCSAILFDDGNDDDDCATHESPHAEQGWNHGLCRYLHTGKRLTQGLIFTS